MAYFITNIHIKTKLKDNEVELDIFYDPVCHTNLHYISCIPALGLVTQVDTVEEVIAHSKAISDLFIEEIEEAGTIKEVLESLHWIDGNPPVYRDIDLTLLD
jgi:predicted RNase H-like HicB family nuclease